MEITFQFDIIGRVGREQHELVRVYYIEKGGIILGVEQAMEHFSLASQIFLRVRQYKCSSAAGYISTELYCSLLFLTMSPSRSVALPTASTCATNILVNILTLYTCCTWFCIFIHVPFM